MKLPITGGCLCGSIRYEITILPRRMGLCHCRSCQRATGSAYFPFLATTNEAIKISGDFTEYALIGFSGKTVHRGFCPTCGSTLFGRPDIIPGLIAVSASSLDNPTEFIPEIDVWVQDAQPWVCMNPTLKKFEKNSF